MIAAGVGLTGSIGLGPVALPLSGLWTALAGLGAVVATAAAAAMVDIERPFASSAIRIVGATAILTLVAAVTIGTAARMISTSPPSFRAEGRGGQSSGGFTPDAQPFGQGRSGFPEGRARPGAVFANLGRLLPIGGIVGAALSLAGLGVSLAAVRGLRRAGEASIVPSDARARTTRVEVGRAALALCAVGAAALLLIQFVPVARTNPPVLTTVAWDSAETKDLFYRACADCHSNETIWPWYASVAPASWLTAIDVNSARRQFNISDLSARNAFGGFVNVNEIQQRIEGGSMPPVDYLLLHPAARLSDAEKQQLVHGLENSLR
jgi:hypothetical protein